MTTRSLNWHTITAFAIFLGVSLFSFVALGQPCPDVDVNVVNEAAQQQEWWMVLLVGLMDILAPLVASILGVLASVAIRKWGKKLDRESQERLTTLVQNMVVSGVAFAEEQGRKALREGSDQTDGASKMQHAVSFVQEQLEESGVGKLAEDKLVKLIESRLHAERTKPDGIVPSDSNGNHSAMS